MVKQRTLVCGGVGQQQTILVACRDAGAGQGEQKTKQKSESWGGGGEGQQPRKANERGGDETPKP